MNTPWLRPLLDYSRTALVGAREILYPRCCLLCGQALPEQESHFCSDCRRQLFENAEPTCQRCGGRVGPFVNTDAGCPACRGEKFAFERVIRLGRYEGMLREVVLRLKNQRGEGLAELLGECWAEKARQDFGALKLDAIVPVPLHWLRRWRRGYNQSAALGRGLATVLDVPLLPNGLRRIRNTPSQTPQTPAGRRANVRGAFRTRAGASVKGRSILLVDDVMTTGATAGEAARALRDGGASRVVVAVLARAQG